MAQRLLFKRYGIIHPATFNDHISEKESGENDIVILTATSGDTGKAISRIRRCKGNKDHCILSKERCQPNSGKTDGDTEGR